MCLKMCQRAKYRQNMDIRGKNFHSMINKNHFFITYIIERTGEISNKLYPWTLNKSGALTFLS